MYKEGKVKKLLEQPNHFATTIDCFRGKPLRNDGVVNCYGKKEGCLNGVMDCYGKKEGCLTGTVARQREATAFCH